MSEVGSFVYSSHSTESNLLLAKGALAASPRVWTEGKREYNPTEKDKEDREHGRPAVWFHLFLPVDYRSYFAITGEASEEAQTRRRDKGCRRYYKEYRDNPRRATACAPWKYGHSDTEHSAKSPHGPGVPVTS